MYHLRPFRLPYARLLGPCEAFHTLIHLPCFMNNARPQIFRTSVFKVVICRLSCIYFGEERGVLIPLLLSATVACQPVFPVQLYSNSAGWRTAYLLYLYLQILHLLLFQILLSGFSVVISYAPRDIICIVYI